MAKVPRLLRREPAIDEAELELARARSLERLRQIGASRHQAGATTDAAADQGNGTAASVAVADASRPPIEVVGAGSVGAPTRPGSGNGHVPGPGTAMVGVMAEPTEAAAEPDAAADDITGTADGFEPGALIDTEVAVEAHAIELEEASAIELPSPAVAEDADAEGVEYASEPIDNADLTAVVLDVADAGWVSNGAHSPGTIVPDPEPAVSVIAEVVPEVEAPPAVVDAGDHDPWPVTVEILPWPDATGLDIAADAYAKRAAEQEEAEEAAARAAAEQAWAEAMAAAELAAAEEAARADAVAAERAAAEQKRIEARAAAQARAAAAEEAERVAAEDAWAAAMAAAEQAAADEQARAEAQAAAELEAAEQARLAQEQARGRGARGRTGAPRRRAGCRRTGPDRRRAGCRRPGRRRGARGRTGAPRRSRLRRTGRIAAEQAAAEQARIAAEQAAAEQAAAEALAAEQARLAQERKKAEALAAEERARAQEQARAEALAAAALAAELARLAEEKRRADEQARIAAEQAAAEEQARLAAEKAAEEARIAAEQAAAEQAAAEQAAAEQARAEEQARVEALAAAELARAEKRARTEARAAELAAADQARAAEVERAAAEQSQLDAAAAEAAAIDVDEADSIVEVSHNGHASEVDEVDDLDAGWPAEMPELAPAPREKARKAHASTSKVSRKAVRLTAPHVPSQASCPYCAHLLVPVPTSNRRCERCRQRIVVRRVDDRVVFLTEASVLVFEAERKRIADSRHWVVPRNQWTRLAASAGAPADKVAKLNETLASPETTEAARNLYLATVDRTVREARQERDWPKAARVRRAQAVAMYRLAGSPETLPADVIALHRDAAAIELRGIAELARDAELVGGSCCDACSAHNGRSFKIGSDLRSVLPHEGCPTGVCACRWRLSDRDRAAVERLLRSGYKA